MNLSAILDIIILAAYSLAILISITILVLICIHCRPLTSDISIVLTFNTYLAVIFCSIFLLQLFANSLYGHLHPTVSLDSDWCYIRGYFAFAFFCAIYWSYVLQAIFRLFRVVFYREKRLQSFKLFLFMIIAQWLLAFIIFLLYYLLNVFAYIPSMYHCQVPFTNIFGFLSMLICLYILPMSIVFIIYIYIVKYIRRTAQTQQHRKSANQRDALVLKRILLLVLALLTLGIPTLCVMIIYWFTHYLVPFAYHMQGLGVSCGLTVQAIVMVLITPQIRKIFKRNGTSVHPISVPGNGQHI